MEWHLVKLGDVCKIEKEQFREGELPYVGLEDIEGFTGCFLGDLNPRVVASSTFKFTSQHVLYGRLRPYLNKVMVPDFEGHCSSEIFPLKPTSQLDRKYLYYWLSSDSIVNAINGTCTGARMPRANVNTILTFEIPLPPILVQKRIVAILDEAFADIVQVRAKTEQNLKNARELFESCLEQVGGEKKPLGEFVSIKTGRLNANAAVEGGHFPFFTCSREIFAIDRFSFDCEAILLAGNNASGDFNVKHYKGKFDAYQRTYVISITDENKLLYPFLYYQMIKSLKELKESSVGAGTRFLKIGMIRNLKISIPSLAEQKEILSTLLVLKDELDRLERVYEEKLECLDELKQSILQKAFSGELTQKENQGAVA